MQVKNLVKISLCGILFMFNSFAFAEINNHQMAAEIDFDINKTNQNLIGNIEITANEGTKSTIILKYETKKNVKAFQNGVVNGFNSLRTLMRSSCSRIVQPWY